METQGGDEHEKTGRQRLKQCSHKPRNARSHQKLVGQSADPKAFRDNLASGHLDPRVPALRAMRGEVLSLGPSLFQQEVEALGDLREG